MTAVTCGGLAVRLLGHRWRRRWTCPGGRIDLMLHPDGHRRPPGWVDMALDWFEALEP